MSKEETPLDNKEVSTSNDLKQLDFREIGNLGLKQVDGVILEECQHELRYPYSIQTFKKMKKDSVVYAATEFIENKIAAVDWNVQIPEGHEEELKDKAEFIKQVLDDMEQPFKRSIRQAATFNSYGFSLLEMVFRFRRKEDGSRYNDGYIGLRKLGFRPQDTICKWDFNKTNKKILGVHQDPVDYSVYDSYSNVDITTSSSNSNYIPYRKILHFSNNSDKDNPEGYSSLKSCWEAWKYKTAYMKVESQGVSKESHGLKVLYIPPQYMKEDATVEEKATFSKFQSVMRAIDIGSSSSAILPLFLDDKGNRMFEMEVKNMTGTSSYNLDNIINRYNNEILTALFANVLTLGSDGGGSHALSESKISIVESMIRSKLDIIKSELNNKLVRTIFEKNGWNTEVMPFFDYAEISNISITEFAKSIQLIKAVGVLPVNRDNVNWIMDSVGSPYRVPEDTTDEELHNMLGTASTRSGDGLNTDSGGLNGTGNEVNQKDNNTNNKERGI